MNRGEIWIAQLPEPLGDRPVVIISRSELCALRSKVTVALGTRTRRNSDVEVAVGRREGLQVEGVISAGDLQTINKSDLVRRVGCLSRDQVEQLDEALLFALGLADHIS